jgi:hypothetical protein
MKIGLIILFIFVQISCSETGKSKNIVSQTDEVSNSVKIETPTATETETPKPKELNVSSPDLLTGGDKQAIYSSLLARIYLDKNISKLDHGDTLIYRLKTILPAGIKQIEQNLDIPKYLIDNFKQANQKTELLDEEYGVKKDVHFNSGDRDLVKFYKATKREYLITKGVVGFSNIGVDQNSSQALVYVEYYRPDTGLIKFYYLMKFEQIDEEIGISGISNIHDFKFLKVNSL